LGIVDTYKQITLAVLKAMPQSLKYAKLSVAMNFSCQISNATITIVMTGMGAPRLVLLSNITIANFPALAQHALRKIYQCPFYMLLKLLKRIHSQPITP
jgi:hypothetical protein